MKRKISMLFVVLAVALMTVSPAAAGRGNGPTGTVYVTSQGLYYDTFVTRDPLPFQGKFQKIENGMTEYGPGDPGYLGGRWWEDTNGNGEMDASDHYFLCPLLGPGRSSP
jgi:hypothetical protein